MDKMKKMLEKKKQKGSMSDVEKDAKMSVVKDMRDMASAMAGDKIRGMKKVSVASPSGEGLKAGVSEAKKLLDSQSEDGHSSMGDDENEMETRPEGEIHDSGMGEFGKDMTPDSTYDEKQEDAMDIPRESHDDEDMDDAMLNEKLQRLLALRDKRSMR